MRHSISSVAFPHFCYNEYNRLLFSHQNSADYANGTRRTVARRPVNTFRGHEGRSPVRCGAWRRRRLSLSAGLSPKTAYFSNGSWAARLTKPVCQTASRLTLAVLRWRQQTRSLPRWHHLSSYRFTNTASKCCFHSCRFLFCHRRTYKMFFQLSRFSRNTLLIQ